MYRDMDPNQCSRDNLPPKVNDLPSETLCPDDTAALMMDVDTFTATPKARNPTALSIRKRRRDTVSTTTPSHMNTTCVSSSTEPPTPRNPKQRRQSSATSVHYPSSLMSPHTPRSNRVRGLVGLVNLGNTCYLNSILQCLLSTSDLTCRLLQPNLRNEVNTSVLSAFSTIWISLSTGLNSTWINPIKVKDALDVLDPQFIGHDQHDSQEALLFLIQGLHEEMKRSIPSMLPECLRIDDLAQLTDIERAERLWMNSKAHNDSVLSDLFLGQQSSTITCLHCKHTRTKYEDMWQVQTPIPKARTRRQRIDLIDCFRAFTDTVSSTHLSLYLCLDPSYSLCPCLSFS